MFAQELVGQVGHRGSAFLCVLRGEIFSSLR